MPALSIHGLFSNAYASNSSISEPWRVDSHWSWRLGGGSMTTASGNLGVLPSMVCRVQLGRVRGSGISMYAIGGLI